MVSILKHESTLTIYPRLTNNYCTVGQMVYIPTKHPLVYAICIDKLGLPSNAVPEFERDKVLEARVWNEILHPEFAQEKPKNAGYLKSWSYMFRRWWANRWKHRIVYNEGLASTFIVQVWSHLLKPKSLKM